MVIDHFRKQMANSGICIPKEEMLIHKQNTISDAEKKNLRNYLAKFLHFIWGKVRRREIRCLCLSQDTANERPRPRTPNPGILSMILYHLLFWNTMLINCKLSSACHHYYRPACGSALLLPFLHSALRRMWPVVRTYTQTWSHKNIFSKIWENHYKKLCKNARNKTKFLVRIV